jgi:hypothetical protein
MQRVRVAEATNMDKTTLNMILAGVVTFACNILAVVLG